MVKPQAKQTKRYFETKNEDDTFEDGNQTQDNVEVFNIKIDDKFLKRQRHKEVNLSKQKPQDTKQKSNYPGKAPIKPEKLEKHSRGEEFQGVGVVHPLHLAKLKKKEKKYKFAQEESARAEILLTEEQGYIEVDEFGKTTSVSQKQIAENVDIAAATKIFDLQLNDFGPYRAKYSRNGRHLLLGGKMGHVAAFDWVTKKLHCEMNVMESVHDISWLHIETMFAVAQKEWLYIYDNTGIELHCIKRMDKILRLQFLPYHFLLAGINEFGFMTWLDVSIGEIVGNYNNKMGRSNVMTQNPYNGTLCVGSAKGVVSLWSPTVREPLAKILCHKTPLTAIAVDPKGMYMATSGVDCSLKIWDIRSLDGPLQHYRLRTQPVDLDFSQKEMLAVGLRDVVEVYSNCCSQTASRPYVRHAMAKSISNHRFCPYEDVLGIATDKGFTSIIVPGSGEPNFDALESNPFMTKKQRREAEVKALLDKIPAELITLNPFEVAEVDVPTLQEKMEARKSLLYLKPKKIDYTPRQKKKGKSSIARKKIIKAKAKKEFIGQAIAVQKQLNMVPKEEKRKKSYGILDRFLNKK